MMEDWPERHIRRHQETLAHFGVALPIVDWLQPDQRDQRRFDEELLCLWVVKQFMGDLEAFEFIVEKSAGDQVIVLLAGFRSGTDPRFVEHRVVIGLEDDLVYYGDQPLFSLESSQCTRDESNLVRARPPRWATRARSPAVDSLAAPTALSVDPRLALAIVVEEKFHLTVEDENPLEFTVTNDYGAIVSQDQKVRAEFLVCSPIMGFEALDRGNLGRTYYKLNHELSGPWRALVEYRGWILRVFDESSTHWLVLAMGDGAREIGLKPIPDMRISFGWLAKVETRQEYRFGGIGERR